MSADDPYSTLETPEALDCAMRLVHARRGTDEIYREELARITKEISDEADEVALDASEEDEGAEWVRAYSGFLAWRYCQLAHALVRIASVTAMVAASKSGALSPSDVLKMVDDALRTEDDEELDAA